MGEIAEMMLDGTMNEWGEWNFDGEDGPGYPVSSYDFTEGDEDDQ